MRLLRPFLFAALLFTASGFQSAAFAQAEAPDALVKRVSTDVLDAVRADPTIQPGNVGKVVELVDAKILPSFDFERMTASAVGPRWKEATPEQTASLQEQFKICWCGRTRAPWRRPATAPSRSSRYGLPPPIRRSSSGRS